MPEKLKIAKVIPIYKKDNYRPISSFPTISKVFEKVIYDQLYTNFYTYDIISNWQYGFRKHNSTELSALELIDRTTFNSIIT